MIEKKTIDQGEETDNKHEGESAREEENDKEEESALQSESWGGNEIEEIERGR